MTSRRSQRENRPDPLDVTALEHEMHSKQGNRQDRRAAERTAAHAEATGFARVTGKHFRSRPTA